MDAALMHESDKGTDSRNSKHSDQAILLKLQASGVHAVQGTGTPLQTFLVHATLVYALILALLNVSTRPGFIWWLPLVIFLIDFLSGLVHWFFDTQVKPGNTLLGRIAIDFLDHHVNPGRTTEVGYIVSAFRPAVWVTLPFCTLATLAPLQTAPAALLFWTGMLSILVPQTHKEVHLSKPNFVIDRIQRSRLILNPGAHQRHHDDTSQSYCVFTGWLNPLLDSSGFWRVLERWATHSRKVLHR